MLNPIICPQCLQPNEQARPLCWKCLRTLSAPPSDKDFVRMFELPSTWKLDDLKAAFRRLARKYHPDANPGNREAETFFKYINYAYESLSRTGNQAPHPNDWGRSDPTQPGSSKSTPGVGAEELNEALESVIHLHQQQNTIPVDHRSRLQKVVQWILSPFLS